MLPAPSPSPHPPPPPQPRSATGVAPSYKNWTPEDHHPHSGNWPVKSFRRRPTAASASPATPSPVPEARPSANPPGSSILTFSSIPRASRTVQRLDCAFLQFRASFSIPLPSLFPRWKTKDRCTDRSTAEIQSRAHNMVQMKLCDPPATPQAIACMFNLVAHILLYSYEHPLVVPQFMHL